MQNVSHIFPYKLALFIPNWCKHKSWYLVPGPVASIMFDQITSDSVIIQWEKPSEPNGLILSTPLYFW